MLHHLVASLDWFRREYGRRWLNPDGIRTRQRRKFTIVETEMENPSGNPVFGRVTMLEHKSPWTALFGFPQFRCENHNRPWSKTVVHR
jgi:hypothetical protein